LDFNEAANVDKPETVHCEEIEQKPQWLAVSILWVENVLGLDRCKSCGRLRRSVVEPDELEEELPTLEENNDNEDSVEEQPDLE